MQKFYRIDFKIRGKRKYEKGGSEFHSKESALSFVLNNFPCSGQVVGMRVVEIQRQERVVRIVK